MCSLVNLILSLNLEKGSCSYTYLGLFPNNKLGGWELAPSILDRSSGFLVPSCLLIHSS